MNDDEMTPRFWLANGLLALALLLLLFMGRLWGLMGAAAMLLWGGLVVAGVYLIMSDKK